MLLFMLLIEIRYCVKLTAIRGEGERGCQQAILALIGCSLNLATSGQQRRETEFSF